MPDLARRWEAALLVPLMLSALAATPTGSAHGAPDPPAWMVRLQHDYNDDWGGHANPHDGHDLIALDVQEAFNATRDVDVLVFRLLFGGGYNDDATKPLLRDVLTFKAKGAAVSAEFRTTDNLRFEGSFHRVRGPFQVIGADGNPDGLRRYIEGELDLPTLGLAVGDALSDFLVQGYADTVAADHMVGGYTLNGQRTDTIPATEEAQPVSYRRPTYTLRGPVAYASSSVDPAFTFVRAGEERGVLWTVASRVDEPQRVTLEAAVPHGVTAVLHGPSDGNPLSFDLAGREETIVHIALTSTLTSPPNPMHLSLTTSLGGHVMTQVPLDLRPSGATEDPAPKGRSPNVAIGLAVALAGAVALLVRRGR